MAFEPTHEELRTYGVQELLERVAELEDWPRNLAESAKDPRCGCGDDCEWDSITQIEKEIEERQGPYWDEDNDRHPHR